MIRLKMVDTRNRPQEPATHALSHYRRFGASESEMEVIPELQNMTQAVPFIFAVRAKGWVPANLIAWGVDKDEAAARVLAGLEECAREQERFESWYNSQEGHLHNMEHTRARDILNGLKDGSMTLSVTPLDPRKILKVGWATNDRLTV